MAAAGLGAKASIPNPRAKPNVAAGLTLFASAADSSGVLATTTGSAGGGAVAATADAATLATTASDNLGAEAKISS